MNELPNIVRARLNARAAGDHPDPDLLTAFAEQALTDPERSKVLSHLSGCADCRDVLALAMPSLAAATRGAAASSLDTGWGRSWFAWPALRWGAVAACVVIVGSAVLLKRDLTMRNVAHVASVQTDAAPSYVAKEAIPAPPEAAMRQLQPQASVSRIEPPVRDKFDVSKRTEKDQKSLDMKRRALVSTPAPTSKTRAAFAYNRAFANAPAGAAGGVVGGTVSVLDKGVVAGHRPAPVVPRSEPNSNILVEGRNANSFAVTPQNQAVEVQSAAPAVPEESGVAADESKRESLGKAKAPSAKAMFDNLGGAPPAPPSAELARAKKEMKRADWYRAPVSRWTISSDGQLQHSVDSGKTWQPVAVADNATFRALSANGPDLWVGGASGLLYHSADAGAHWTQVRPATADATLTNDVAAIEFTDTQHGKITTSTGEVWLTDDGGQAWRKQT